MKKIATMHVGLAEEINSMSAVFVDRDILINIKEAQMKAAEK